MGFLLNSDFDEGRGIEDLSTWGVDRLYKFLEMFDEYFVQGEGKNNGDEPFGVFLYYEMKNILMDMDIMIYRFLDEATGRKKTVKEHNIEMVMNANEEQSEAIYKKILDAKAEKTENSER